MRSNTRSVNLHQLRIFAAVARHGSFSRAADELQIRQPSVSIQVAELERALGIDLFEQLGRRTYLTEAGRILDEYARRILGLAEEAQTVLEELRGMRLGRLALGASATPGTYLLPRIIGRFQERYPQISVTLEIADAEQIQSRLLRNELDLGVVGWDVTAGELHVEPFRDDELVLVVPPAHPLAATGGTPAQGLHEYRLILPERGSGTREALEAALQAAGVALTPAMELSSSEAIKEAVAAGVGIAILSRVAVARELEVGRLVVVPILDLVIRRRFFLIRHQGKRLSQPVKAFLDMLQASGTLVAS